MCVLLVLATIAFGVPIRACDLPPGYAGFATYQTGDPHQVHTAIEVARRYAKWLEPTAATKRDVSWQKAAAIYVLAHELGHLHHRLTSGLLAEQQADMWARANYCWVVTTLGYLGVLNRCEDLRARLPAAYRTHEARRFDTRPS